MEDSDLSDPGKDRIKHILTSEIPFMNAQKIKTRQEDHQYTETHRPASQHISGIMDAKIDSTETDQKDEADKKERDQIGNSFVFQITATEKEQHAIKNQYGKGMATGEAVASLADQMESQIGSGAMKGNL